MTVEKPKKKKSKLKIVLIIIAIGFVWGIIGKVIEDNEKNKPESNYVHLYNIHKSKINVRDKPSTKSKILGSVQPDELIKVIGAENEKWKKIDFNGSEGYVYGKFFAKEKAIRKKNIQKKEIIVKKVKKVAAKKLDKIDLSQAKPYAVIEEDDTSASGRNRMSFSITSNAKTIDERAQTAMKAAIDLQEKSGADFISINLEISEDFLGMGYALALITYSPDGKGVSGRENGKYWSIKVSTAQPKQQSVKIVSEWIKNTDKFKKETKYGKETDEERLNSFIADSFGVSVEDVSNAHLELSQIIINRKPYKRNKAINTVQSKIEPPKKKVEKDYSSNSVYPCNQIVKKRLTNPSSADFPWAPNKIFQQKNQIYIVKSYVDAKNDYGVVKRSNFHCRIQYTGGQEIDPRNWKLLEMEILPE